MAQFWYDSRSDIKWESLPTEGWMFPCTICNLITARTLQVSHSCRQVTVYMCNVCQKDTEIPKIKRTLERRYIRHT